MKYENGSVSVSRLTFILLVCSFIVVFALIILFSKCSLKKPTPKPGPTPTVTPTPTPTPTPPVATEPTVESLPEMIPQGKGKIVNRAQTAGTITPFSGALMHVSEIAAGMHQHYFTGASTPLQVLPGETLIQYIYLDPANLPREVMVQWFDGSWDHRAYWGEDLIDFGITDLVRTYMGPLPDAGKWVRLEIPARLIDLENRQVNGWAYTLFDGRAYWDYSAKTAATPAPTPTPTPTVTPTPMPSPTPIVKPVAKVEVNCGQTIIRVGKQVAFTAIAYDAGGNPVPASFTWKSSNANATVDVIGIVTGVKAGTATITATAGGKSGQRSITVK